MQSVLLLRSVTPLHVSASLRKAAQHLATFPTSWSKHSPLFMLPWFTGCPDPSRATTLISPCKQLNNQCKIMQIEGGFTDTNYQPNKTTHGQRPFQSLAVHGACQVGHLTPVKMARCFRRQFSAAASEFTAVSCTSCLVKMMSSIFNHPIQNTSNTSKYLKLQHDIQSSCI